MAELTPAQRAAADAMIAGTFDKLGAPPAYMAAPTSVEEMYRGIYPAKPTMAASGTRPPTTGQAAAIREVPAGSYIPPRSVPISDPRIPAGSAYANTGNKGRASGAMLQQLELAGYAPAGAGGATVPLPRPRPGYAPSIMDIAAMNRPVVGAKPGMGGAMIGNGIMAPGIPLQGPPPPGVAPTVWAGDPQPQATGGAPIMRPTGPTGVFAGRRYVNGQQAGYAPIMVAGGSYTPSNGSQAYALSNLAGQEAALARQAAATGQTGVYHYTNGVRGPTVTGGSGAQAYEAAAARSRDRGTGGEGGNPTWW